jgi:SAM-dependent methyltransferase
MNPGQSMRQDWDARARKDAFFYIASWRNDWDEASFFQSGEEDYARLVEGVLARRNFSTRDKSMLELGCGAGRMTRAFARRFQSVAAFDVSCEMLAQAKTLCAAEKNIAWVQGNGTDLAAIPSGSVDFVFSYLVLQHLPHHRLVHAYISEMFRVLRPQGFCLFQFNASTMKNMNWKGRIAWNWIDLLCLLKLGAVARATARLLGLDPEMAGKNWHGAAVRADRVASTVRSLGGTAIELAGEGTPMAWCSAWKGSAGPVVSNA